MSISNQLPDLRTIKTRTYTSKMKEGVDFIRGKGSSSGILFPKLGISIDYFDRLSCKNVDKFFLTHLHADHTCGLTSTWNCGTIYTSPMNKRLAPLLTSAQTSLFYALALGETIVLRKKLLFPGNF